MLYFFILLSFFYYYNRILIFIDSCDNMINSTIFITGTPCTGKTTISQLLFDKFNIKKDWDVKLLKTNDLALENNLILGTHPEKEYKIVDIDNLDKIFTVQKEDFFKKHSNLNKLLLFEGHLSHFCTGADKVIILRVYPDKLKLRLNGRNYNNSKIFENLQAEALAVCSVEAYEIYKDNSFEIDVTDKSPYEILNIICEIILDKLEPNIGSVDFTSWLINNDIN